MTDMKENTSWHGFGVVADTTILDTMEVSREDKIKQIQEYAVRRGIKEELFIPHIMYLFESNIFQVRKQRDRKFVHIEAYNWGDDIDLNREMFNWNLNQVSLQKQNIKVIDFLYTVCKDKK